MVLFSLPHMRNLKKFLSTYILKEIGAMNMQTLCWSVIQFCMFRFIFITTNYAACFSFNVVPWQDTLDYAILGAASKLAAILTTYPFQVNLASYLPLKDQYSPILLILKFVKFLLSFEACFCFTFSGSSFSLTGKDPSNHTPADSKKI